ncbi:ATP-grasp peptide maturase system methyltransferase [Nonomuraea sp. NPDC026600]|uniref:ATP-grasp peptide maturase system methyltransferase n=1 Tax=Nonomuraea sp. NPDC026600 TaxID=3155363 RepID=UPI0033D30853
MSDPAATLRLELADKIGSAGWRKALETVPRERFLGEAVYRPDKNRFGWWTPVRRADTPEGAWLALAYANETWPTQVEGLLAEDSTRPVSGYPSSSSTLPSLVVRMLEAAEIEEGDKVLEIGTGTGYSTALMCQRLGNAAVFSIEYDPLVAARARDAIMRAGYAPTLVEGDGLRGHAENAKYDRLIATCSVRTIPWDWPQQIRGGGTITAPLSGWMGETAFAHLTVDDDDGGTASGRFLEDDLSFMTARSHLPPPRPPLVRGLGIARESRVDPSVLQDRTALWVAQLAIPQAQIAWGDGATFLVDAGTGSRAEAQPDPARGWTVRQHGPLKLWDAVEKAIKTWQEAGSPHKSGFGLTVTREGQRVWLGDPAGPDWSLPA